jgi:hypothetical protein
MAEMIMPLGVKHLNCHFLCINKATNVLLKK